MRCLACDVKLNDYELTRKYADSGEFVDLCSKCYHTIADDVNATGDEEKYHEEGFDE